MRIKQFNEAEIEIPTFEAQAQEIKNIYAATETTLAEYTEANAKYDRECLFG